MKKTQEFASDADKRAQEVRSKKYGIRIREGGSITKPSEYASVPDSEFADPVNYAYPIDSAHVVAAYKYFAKPENQGFYNADEKKKIWGQIITALPENMKESAKKVAGFSDEGKVEEFQEETFQDLMTQLEEIHGKMKDMIKEQKGAPAARHQMIMVSKLLDVLDPAGKETMDRGEFSGEFKPVVVTFSEGDHVETFASDDFTILPDSSPVWPNLGKVQKHTDLQSGVEVPFVDKLARVFICGTHRGKDYSPQYIDELNRKFQPPQDVLHGWRQPLQADHSKSCNDTIGHPRKIWRNGIEVFSILRYAGVEAVNKVISGLYGPLSSGINNIEKVWDHIAHTPFPAIEGAEVFEKGGMPTEQIGEGKSNMKGDEKIMDPKDEMITKLQKELETQKAEFARVQEEAGSSAKQKEEFAKVAQEREEFAKRIATMEEEVRFSKDEKFIETFCQPDGKGQIKTVPGMKNEEFALYHALDDPNMIGKQRELFAAYKAKMPGFVDTNVYNTQKHVKPGEQSDEEAKAQAERMAGKT